MVEGAKIESLYKGRKDIICKMVNYDANIDLEVLNYCDRVWAVVRRIRGERKIRKRDFPPVVVSCSDGIGTESSYTHGPEECVYHPLIENALTSNLGPIGGHTQYEPSFRIGRCAEPNAANKLIKKSNGRITNLNQVRFSQALRPFTKEPRDYCQNCQHTF